ncbi:MAG: MtrB/PioB family decaheme-associated outer membrane protein [Desulfobacterales bacterium]|nr:MtrB/PioB family decaheme-associated outer membrane protein [Desulfobacterales bacterium]
MPGKYLFMRFSILSILSFALAMTGRPMTIYAQSAVKGNVEIGWRFQDKSRDSSKYTEYREMPSGFFVDKLSLGSENKDRTFYFDVSGSHVAREDQNLDARFGRWGKYQVELEWDEIPHNFSNSAKSLFSDSGGGVYTIPVPVRQRLEALVTTDTDPVTAGVQPDFAAIRSEIQRSSRDIELISKRAKAKGALVYTPKEPWKLSLNYSNEKRSGKKPLGGAFGFATSIETIEPTEYRTQEIRAAVEYFGKDWSAELGYFLSTFENDVDALGWDNPFRVNDAVGAASRGRMDLYPDNTAQKVHFSGAANLPFATRFVTTLSHGWREQNDKFIPFTINSAVAASAATLPSNSLNGEVKTTLLDFYLTNRFFSKVGLTARFRYYDYDNQTPSLTFPAYVRTDETVVATERRNAPDSYRKINGSADASFRLKSNLSLKVGFAREEKDRRYREAAETSENIYKVSLDYTPRMSWLLLRTSYAFAEKVTLGYDGTRGEYARFPSGDPDLGQLPQLRKFDIASRKRNQASLLTQVTPSDKLSLTASFGLANDDFNASRYGLLGNNSYNLSFDVSYNPSYNVTLFAGITWENFDYKMKSRERQAGNDSTENDWVSKMEDQVNTLGVGLSWAVIPKKVDFKLDFNYSKAKGAIATHALGNPANPNFLPTSAADYPDTQSTLQQLRASVSYHLTERLTSRLEYAYERYTEMYFNRDGVDTYMQHVDPGASRSVFLAATEPNYYANIVHLVLSYKF